VSALLQLLRKLPDDDEDLLSKLSEFDQCHSLNSLQLIQVLWPVQCDGTNGEIRQDQHGCVPSSRARVSRHARSAASTSAGISTGQLSQAPKAISTAVNNPRPQLPHTASRDVAATGGDDAFTTDSPTTSVGVLPRSATKGETASGMPLRCWT